MPSIADLLSAMQNGVTAINNVSQSLASTFLQSGTVVSTAITTTNSTIAITSSLAAGFLAVTTSSGAAYYIPIYR